MILLLKSTPKIEKEWTYGSCEKWIKLIFTVPEQYASFSQSTIPRITALVR